jgi:hypothetical protein
MTRRLCVCVCVRARGVDPLVGGRASRETALPAGWRRGGLACGIPCLVDARVAAQEPHMAPHTACLARCVCVPRSLRVCLCLVSCAGSRSWTWRAFSTSRPGPRRRATGSTASSPTGAPPRAVLQARARRESRRADTPEARTAPTCIPAHAPEVTTRLHHGRTGRSGRPHGPVRLRETRPRPFSLSRLPTFSPSRTPAFLPSNLLAA